MPSACAGRCGTSGNRLKLSPVDPNDLRILIDMGYVEMKGDQPVATDAGLQEIGG